MDDERIVITWRDVVDLLIVVAFLLVTAAVLTVVAGDFQGVIDP